MHNFLGLHCLRGKFNIFSKVVSIIFAVFVPLGLLLQMVLKNGDRGHYPLPVRTTFVDSSKIGALSGSSLWKKSQETQATPKTPLPRTHSFANTKSPLRSNAPGIWHLNPRSIVAFVWGIFACYVITEIEMIIRQNKIKGMYNPTKAGQIIPMVIGILQFCAVTYEYWIDTKHKEVSTCSVGANNKG